MTGVEAAHGQVPFHEHIELLQLFLAHRDEALERIEGVLNAQRKPAGYQQDGRLLSLHFEECLFRLPGMTPDGSRLRRQLDEAHWASGFKPRKTPGLHNDLVDPAEMMMRAFHLWNETRWPGHSGRVRYAHTLFNLYVIRRLILLSMRLWDAGPAVAGDRLSEVQGVLDELWRTTPDDHPVLVRDARWLIPVAQSPTTDQLAGYFEVAERVAGAFSKEDRLEIHKASVLMAGGHLRSQLRHLSVQKGVPIDERALVLSTRNSNALDLALLVQGLVPLLGAYEDAIQSGDGLRRLDLADSICQGISPDPELFLNRIDLLRPYSMIEYLFIAVDAEENAVYTPMGLRHVQLLDEYESRIRRVARDLHNDCGHFRPVDGAYSPYGVIYGFSSNLLEHMALKTVRPDAATQFSLEDVFSDGDDHKLAWVSGWRKLPHIKPEVARLFDYPHEFARESFDRIERALEKHVSEREAAPSGRLLIPSQDDPRPDSEASTIPDLPARYFRSTDRQTLDAQRAQAANATQLMNSRLEGEFLLSYPVPGGWVALSKDVLTEVLGEGCDAKVVGLPRGAAEVVSLMCPRLVTARRGPEPG